VGSELFGEKIIFYRYQWFEANHTLRTSIMNFVRQIRVGERVPFDDEWK